MIGEKIKFQSSQIVVLIFNIYIISCYFFIRSFDNDVNIDAHENYGMAIIGQMLIVCTLLVFFTSVLYILIRGFMKKKVLKHIQFICYMFISCLLIYLFELDI